MQGATIDLLKTGRLMLHGTLKFHENSNFWTEIKGFQNQVIIVWKNYVFTYVNKHRRQNQYYGLNCRCLLLRIVALYIYYENLD